MAAITVLSAADIEKVFTVADALDAVEDAYRQKAEGQGVAWPMVYAAFEPGVADMDIRSGELAGSGLFGLKLTAWFSQNPAQSLPEIFGTTLICDNGTGAPLALLNASAITGLRTGGDGLTGLEIESRTTGEKRVIDCDGLFVAIGLIPENEPFADLAALNAYGYFDSDEQCLTRTPGVFVAGDCRSKSVRQLATAIADGATAALAACRWLGQG